MNMPTIFHNRVVGALIAILFLPRIQSIGFNSTCPPQYNKPMIFSLSHVKLFSKVLALDYIPTSHIMGPFYPQWHLLLSAITITILVSMKQCFTHRGYDVHFSFVNDVKCLLCLYQTFAHLYFFHLNDNQLVIG